MSKVFAVIKSGVVDNIVLADEPLPLSEDDIWIDISLIDRLKPNIGDFYVNGLFVPRAKPIEKLEDLKPITVVKVDLLENQTLTPGEFVFQGNNCHDATFLGFVFGYNANSNNLVLFDTSGDLDVNSTLLTVNTTLNLSVLVPSSMTINISSNVYSYNTDIYTFPLPPRANLEQFLATGNVASYFENDTTFQNLINPPPPPEPEKISNLSKYAFRMRFTNAEYANILLASKTDIDVQVWLETFNMSAFVRLEAPNTKSDIEMFVEKGILTQERADVILNTPMLTTEAYINSQ